MSLFRSTDELFRPHGKVNQDMIFKGTKLRFLPQKLITIRHGLGRYISMQRFAKR
jgi:hypothetical protein